METIKCIKERRSVRKYLDKEIPREVMNEIIEVASYAPSWKNTQVIRYIVVNNREIMDKIANDCVCDFPLNKKIISRAKSLVIVTAVLGQSGFNHDGSYATTKEDRWENFDAGIACQTFCLAAKDKGIGTVIVGLFDEYKTAEVVDIPEKQKIVAFIAAGYETGEEQIIPARKSVEELVTYIED